MVSGVIFPSFWQEIRLMHVMFECIFPLVHNGKMITNSLWISQSWKEIRTLYIQYYAIIASNSARVIIS